MTISNYAKFPQCIQGDNGPLTLSDQSFRLTRQDRKVGGATGKMKENAVNVCLRIITLVVEEFKAETFALMTTLSFFKDFKGNFVELFSRKNCRLIESFISREKSSTKQKKNQTNLF